MRKDENLAARGVPRIHGCLEDQPRTFGSAAEALHWADPFALDPRLKDQLHKIKVRQVEQPMRGGPSLTELEDLAHTISVELCRMMDAGEVSWMSGALFRYIYGQKRGEDELAANLGAIAWNGPGDGWAKRHKTKEQCERIARAVIYGVRGSESFGMRPLSSTKLAERVGMTRESLRDHWASEIVSIRAEVDRRLKTAAAAFDARLRTLGIVD